MVDSSSANRLDPRILGVALALGLINGLIYVFLVPPWQHYDEPNHFEYAWLVANDPGVPHFEDQDPALSHSVVELMIQNGFYGAKPPPSDLSAGGKPVSIGGFSQLDEPPFYYLAASLPLRFLSSRSVTDQLYASRIVSLVFFLISITAAWGFAGELTRSQSLRWLVPLTLSLLPGFVDIMTSVNNDVAAVALFSLFIWVSVRFIKRGGGVLEFFLLLVFVALCLVTKSTVYVALPLAGIVLIFALLGERYRRQVLWGLAIAGLLLGISAVTWGDAALWYRSNDQEEMTRLRSDQAVSGKFVLQLNGSAITSPRWLVPVFQPLPREQGRLLAGNMVTMGVWMWADQPVQTRTPILHAGSQVFSEVVSLTQTPIFYALPAEISPESTRIWVTLAPFASQKAGAGHVVYYDGFVLAAGERPLDESPVFLDENGTYGEWGGQPFENSLRNASFERAGPRIRLWLDKLGALFLPDNSRPSFILASVFDPQGSSWFFQSSAARLLRTFWAQFGWGQVPLLGNKPYRILGVITAILALGSLVGLWRRRQRFSAELALFLVFILLATWGATFLRGSIYLAVPHIYLPVARYAYPGILPTALVLCLGWVELTHGAGLFIKSGKRLIFRADRAAPDNSLGIESEALPGGSTVQILVYTLLFIILDILSILSIHHFYTL